MLSIAQSVYVPDDVSTILSRTCCAGAGDDDTLVAVVVLVLVVVVGSGSTSQSEPHTRQMT